MNLVKLSHYQLLKNFVLLGHLVGDLCFSMLYSIFAVRWKYVVFNSFFIIWNFRYCLIFLKSILVYNRGLILFVNTDPALKLFIRHYSEICGASYVVSKWISGFLTNFRQFVILLRDFKDGVCKFDFFLDFFSGLMNLSRLPIFVVISSVLRNRSVVNEARRLQIAVAGVVDSNFSGLAFSFPIPGNDDSISSLVFLNAVFSRCILLATFCKLGFFIRLKQ